MEIKKGKEEATVLIFFVNGKKIVEEHADPEITLLTYLRRKLHLTGSKLGCGEGGCGACTVMVSKWDENKEKVKHFAVNSCLAPVVSMHKCAVTTIEGIGNTKTKLHQVQERLARFHGAQCGFCTPGIVMSMYALLRNKGIPTSHDIDECLQGNLCRCTGYRPIVEAFETFACCKGDKCCKNRSRECSEKENMRNSESSLAYDSSQEIIFPAELRMLGKTKSSVMTCKFVGERVTWFQPSSLSEVVRLKSDFPEARIVVGNTEVGIETTVKGNCYPCLISPINVPEMNVLKVEEDGVRIGSSCSLKDISEFLQKISGTVKIEKTQTFSAILKMFQLFAGTQIRNVACLGGNIMTASPISDINPILVASGTRLKFFSQISGLREADMNGKFFTGYRKTATAADEVLVDITIPFTMDNEVLFAFKQSKRRDDDIAIVNAAMRVVFCPGTSKVNKFYAAFGGMAPVTKVPRKTMKRMTGRSWNEELLKDTLQWLREDMELALDSPGGMVEYRRTLVTSFFFKFYHHVLDELSKKGLLENSHAITKDVLSDTSDGDKIVQGLQTWEKVPDEQNLNDTIGRPIPHLSVQKHATGESEYVDDMPDFKDELNMALVYSSRAHAKILRVDTTKALACSGVVAYFSREDVMGQNDIFGEQVFADGKVTCIGDVIGAIVADTQGHAVIASRLVKVEYEDIQPKIITIEEAIEHNSFHIPRMKLIKGDAGDMFSRCDHILEGEMRVGGQEHFYLETQACIAVPHNKEEEMEIWSSCQSPTMLQIMIGLCLGLPRNKVSVRVKRMGGGFGGKETQFHIIATPAAVAAKILGRPIRCMLTRQDDMQVTGGRHPFLGKYKVGFNNDGRVVSLYEELYANAGNTIDLSAAVVAEATLQADYCYNIPNMEIQGHTCRTNLVSNTAMRGFGSPQSTIITEDWITRVSSFLDKPPEEIRKLNLYKDGDKTHFGHTLQNCLLDRCWKEVTKKSDFERNKKKIEEFNAKNRWKKRGICCIPSRFSIGLGEALHLNQAGALVVVYSDGSVLLTHGGTEMGQGLHTKMCQVASRVLDIPLSFIHISETSTSTVPNTSATAGSLGSDLNGMAVKNACEKIRERLDPLKKQNPGLNWPQLAHKAYMERISLSATGFYKVPDIGANVDFKNGIIEGNYYNYLTYGATVSQVEIDVLTGHHVVLRTDIVIDVGNSLNPAIDVGQVEGAFMQGYGMVTLEEHMYSSSGKLWTVGPGAYKIPGFSDAPKQLNVHFMQGCPNDKAIYSSKAVGEPPLLSACSVFYAIKAAIASARKDNGLSGPFRLDSPATSAKIRMACGDELSVQASSSSAANKEAKPWAIYP